LPTVPPVREVVVTENGTETVINKLAVAVLAGLLESVTSTVKLEMLEVLGVPVIVPLEALRLSPAGSEPEISAQV
jgi:hypothetical protein